MGSARGHGHVANCFPSSNQRDYVCPPLGVVILRIFLQQLACWKKKVERKKKERERKNQLSFSPNKIAIKPEFGANNVGLAK